MISCDFPVNAGLLRFTSVLYAGTAAATLLSGGTRP